MRSETSWFLYCWTNNIRQQMFLVWKKTLILLINDTNLKTAMHQRDNCKQYEINLFPSSIILPAKNERRENWRKRAKDRESGMNECFQQPDCAKMNPSTKGAVAQMLTAILSSVFVQDGGRNIWEQREPRNASTDGYSSEIDKCKPLPFSTIHFWMYTCVCVIGAAQAEKAISQFKHLHDGKPA